MTFSQQSVLIIGSTGKTGTAIARQLFSLQDVRVSALVRNPDKLDETKFYSITKGDARKASDIEAALKSSQANWVVLCIGNGDDYSKSDIRTANAKATAAVLKKSTFSHVRVMVLSSTGAGPSKMNIGFGIGVMVGFQLRHVLADHTGQELACSKLDGSRVTIVRATALTENEPVGNLVSFGDHDRCPTIKTDCEDLAIWIVNEMCGTPTLPNGGAINITGKKGTRTLAVKREQPVMVAEKSLLQGVSSAEEVA